MADTKRAAKATNFPKILDSYQTLVAKNSPAQPLTPRTSVEDEIIRERKLRNDNTELDIKLKAKTLNILFICLGIETVLIFYFTYLQATGDHHFHLDDWSFKLVVSATLAQITAMLFVAVNYLFPKKKD